MGDFFSILDNEWQGIATSAIGPTVEGPIRLEISPSEIPNSVTESYIKGAQASIRSLILHLKKLGTSIVPLYRQMHRIRWHLLPYP